MQQFFIVGYNLHIYLFTAPHWMPADTQQWGH